MVARLTPANVTVSLPERGQLAPSSGVPPRLQPVPARSNVPESAYGLFSRPPEGPRYPNSPATRSLESRARSGTETLPIQKCIIPVRPYARCDPLSTHLASASDGRSRRASEVYRTLQYRTTRRKCGVVRSDSTARRDSRLAFGLHLPVDPPRRAPRRSRYQDAGFLMLVPGMGSGSCECRNPLALTCREKSACAMSCRDGLPVPGVTNPIRLPRCRRTSRMASAMSLSLPTTTPQSQASSQPSFSRCTARLTSEPFSSVLITSTVRWSPTGYASGARRRRGACRIRARIDNEPVNGQTSVPATTRIGRLFHPSFAEEIRSRARNGGCTGVRVRVVDRSHVRRV